MVKGKTRRTNRQAKDLTVVEIRYVPTPGAGERLSRVVDILLKSATRKMSQQSSMLADKEKPPTRTRCEVRQDVENGECEDGNQRNLRDF